MVLESETFIFVVHIRLTETYWLYRAHSALVYDSGFTILTVDCLDRRQLLHCHLLIISTPQILLGAKDLPQANYHGYGKGCTAFEPHVTSCSLLTIRCYGIWKSLPLPAIDPMPVRWVSIGGHLQSISLLRMNNGRLKQLTNSRITV